MSHDTNQDRVGDECGPFSFLKLIAEASAVFVALTFVSGWSYLESYYRTFGLNPIELDFPVPVVATIALHMLYESGWPLPTVALIVVVLVVASRHFTHSKKGYRGWIVATLLLLMVCCATAALIRGRQNANSDITEESSNLPFIAFSSKSEMARLYPAEQPSCIGYQTFGGMDCKLLSHSHGLYYFFQPIPRALAEKRDKLDLFVIPESDVLGMHFQRGIELPRSPK